MPKNNIEQWRSRREWLDYNEYTEELKAIGNEIYIVHHVIMALPVEDCLREGLSSILNSLAEKVCDLAHGRLSVELLPE